MAVDVSKIPNNNKFDPVREAILKLQQDVTDGVAGVATVNSSDGNITITNSGTITVGTVGETITIGIDDSTYLTSADLSDYLSLSETGLQTIAGDITISGDLTVSGTTTYINTNHLNIGDNIITLNADLPATTAPSENAGIEINRGSSPTVDFLWNETSNEWDLQTYSGARIYRYGVGSTALTIEAGSTAGDAIIALTPNTTGLGGVIRTTNARPIAFQPNSTTKVIIASDGNMNVYEKLAVGKTTAASTYPLEVDGAVLAQNFKAQMTASGTTYTGTIDQYNNSMQIRTDAGGAISLGGSGTGSVQNNVYIKNGDLDVNGDVTADNFIGDGSQLTNLPGGSDTLQDVTDNGATTTNSITVGDGTADNILTVYYSDNSRTEVRGYGVLFSRGTAYLRPMADGTQTLYIGGSAADLDWGVISAKYSSAFLLSKNGTERFRVDDNTRIISGNLQMGSTTVIDSSRNLTNIGTGAFSGIVTIGGYIDLSSTLYTRSNLEVLNAAGNGWTQWATRSGGNYNLNVGSVTASSFSGNGSGITNVNADTVDGLNSTDFVRIGEPVFSSNTSDDTTGPIEFIRASGSGWDDYIIKHGSSKGMFSKQGVGWHSHTNSSFHVLSSGWVANFGVNSDGTTVSRSSSRAPIFYDSDNTAYYTNPASTSVLNYVIATEYKLSSSTNNARFNSVSDWGTRLYTDSGYIQFGPANTGHAHIYTDRSNFYFNKQIQLLGVSQINQNDIRTPILYDSNNTGYYVDPASTSNLSGLTVANQISGSINGASNAVAITGYGNGNFTFHQTSGSFNVFSGWHNYLISNHGNGSSYYNTIIAMPFWGSPRYSRLEGGTQRGPYEFWTSERTIDSSYDVYAPRYYDKNNTGYYVDPASTTNINAVQGTRIGISNSSSTSRYGLSLYGGYSSGEPTYGILFTGTSLGTHGSVTGSWATYFTMNNDTSRGWIFRRAGSANCASISAGGTASFNGDVIAYYSDMRLKTKLGDIEDPIGKIQALNGFYYEPNEVAKSYGYEKETRVGLSAQEVEAVLPEIVTDAPIGDGYKTVDYAKLVPVLVEAIKEQQKQIDELKKLINP